MKRTLAFLLVLAMLVCMVPAFAVSAAEGECTITEFKNETVTLLPNKSSGWYYTLTGSSTEPVEGWNTTIPEGWAVSTEGQLFDSGYRDSLDEGQTNLWEESSRDVWIVRKLSITADQYTAWAGKTISVTAKHTDEGWFYMGGKLLFRNPNGTTWLDNLKTFATAYTVADVFTEDTDGSYYSYVAAHAYHNNPARHLDMSVEVIVQTIEGDPYNTVTVANADEYADYVNKVNNGDVRLNGNVPVTVTVTGDLDFTDKAYTPLNSLTNTVIDFGGYTLSGIAYENNNIGNDAGLIVNAMTNSVVKNLILKDSTATVSKGTYDVFFGAIVGWCNMSLVTNITLDNVTLTNNCNGIGQHGGIGGLIGAKDGVYAGGDVMEDIVLKNVTLVAPRSDASLVINRIGKGNSPAFDYVLGNVSAENVSVEASNASAGVSSALVYQNNIVDEGYSFAVDTDSVSVTNLVYNSKLSSDTNHYSAYYQTRAGKNGTIDYRLIVVANDYWINAVDKASAEIKYTFTFKSTDGVNTRSFNLAADTIYASVTAQSAGIVDKYTAADNCYIFGWVITGVPTDYANESGEFAPTLALNIDGFEFKCVLEDLSSNANSAEVMGGAILPDATSPNGFATNGYFVASDANGNVNTAISGTSNFTIGTYVRLDDLNNNNVIFAKHDYQVTLKVNGNGDLEYFTYTEEYNWKPIIQISLATAGITDANAWYYIACVREGATIRLYVNGVEVGTASTDTAGTVGTGASLTTDLSFGADYARSIFGRCDFAFAHVIPEAATADKIAATYTALKDGTAVEGAYTAEDAVVWYDASIFG